MLLKILNHRFINVIIKYIEMEKITFQIFFYKNIVGTRNLNNINTIEAYIIIFLRVPHEPFKLFHIL